MSFSPEILKVIESEIVSKESEMGEDYKNMMEIYLKNHLISTYKNL